MYVIKGNPIPLARARVSKGVFYDPQSDLKEAFAWEYKLHPGAKCYSGALKLTVTFYMAIPKMSAIKKEKTIGTHHAKRPDLSNMIKFLEDAIMGLAYMDDAFISVIEAYKVYDLCPRTEFTIEEL